MARTGLDLCGAALTLALTVAALPRAAAQNEEEAAMCVAAEVPLERQLRQLYLDMLGRPPRIDEYRAQQRRGAIRDEDIAALMDEPEFFERMKTYHRALLRANVSASVPDSPSPTALDAEIERQLVDLRGKTVTCESQLYDTRGWSDSTGRPARR